MHFCKTLSGIRFHIAELFRKAGECRRRSSRKRLCDMHAPPRTPARARWRVYVGKRCRLSMPFEDTIAIRLAMPRTFSWHRAACPRVGGGFRSLSGRCCPNTGISLSLGLEVQRKRLERRNHRSMNTVGASLLNSLKRAEAAPTAAAGYPKQTTTSGDVLQTLAKSRMTLSPSSQWTRRTLPRASADAVLRWIILRTQPLSPSSVDRHVRYPHGHQPSGNNASVATVRSARPKPTATHCLPSL